LGRLEFSLTLWLAFLVSRFIGFVLERMSTHARAARDSLRDLEPVHYVILFWASCWRIALVSISTSTISAGFGVGSLGLQTL